MRPATDVAQVIDLAAHGVSEKEIARRLSTSRETVQRWLQSDPELLLIRREPCRGGESCPRVAAAPRACLAYLLGLYLGDGHIVIMRNGVAKLTIYCADDYPHLMARCEAVLASVMPQSKDGRQQRQGCVAVHSHSKHWLCLFPQHGTGRKHERSIALTPWQRPLLEEHPKALLAGLLHSDGCRAINRVQSRGRWYAYPRYFFSNMSTDILGIFGDTCDQLGIEWRFNRPNSISIARRRSVEQLDLFVGPKR